MCLVQSQPSPLALALVLLHVLAIGSRKVTALAGAEHEAGGVEQGLIRPEAHVVWLWPKALRATPGHTRDRARLGLRLGKQALPIYTWRSDDDQVTYWLSKPSTCTGSLATSFKQV